MNREELKELLDRWENLPVLMREIEQNPGMFHLLMEIALYDDWSKSWRAAWLADKIHERFPEVILPYLAEMTERLKVLGDSGKKRHILKLISMHAIPEKDQGFLLDYCLNALVSAKEPPAVRVHAMQILFNLTKSEPDLRPEILAVIEHEMEYHATPGILSRGKKLVKQLREGL